MKKKKMLMCNVSSLVTYSVTTACRIRSLALVRLWHVPKREQWKNDRPILHASVTFGFNDEPANKLSRRRQLPVGRGRITDRYVGTVRQQTNAFPSVSLSCSRFLAKVLLNHYSHWLNYVESVEASLILCRRCRLFHSPEDVRFALPSLSIRFHGHGRHYLSISKKIEEASDPV